MVTIMHLLHSVMIVIKCSILFHSMPAKNKIDKYLVKAGYT